MTHAYLVDGLDHEQRDAFEKALRGESDKTKAKRERETVEALMRFTR